MRRIAAIAAGLALLLAGAAPASGAARVSLWWPVAKRSTTCAAAAKKTPKKQRRGAKAVARAKCAKAKPASMKRPAAAAAPGGDATTPGTVTPVTPAPPSSPSPPALPVGTDPVLPGAPVTSSTLGVEAHDTGNFVLRLTRTSVPAGNLTVYFRNYDSSAHNLWLDAPQPGTDAARISAEVYEGEGATKTVAVTPGAWRLYCSLPGHGTMDRTLTVQ